MSDRPAVTLHVGDCLDLLADLPDASVDAVITDPPYGLAELKPAQVAAAITAWAGGDRARVPDGRGFMGRTWDAFVPPPAVWDHCLRVLKPGGHLAAFAGSGTTLQAARDAGFESIGIEREFAYARLITARLDAPPDEPADAPAPAAVADAPLEESPLPLFDLDEATP